MNIKDFSQPTILTGKQYGTTITIELDHSDTSIDEVMDGFLTIVKGLGYLDTTINEWIKDKSKDIYDDEYEIMSNSLADDWFNDIDTDEDCGCGNNEWGSEEEYDEWNDEEVDWKGWDSVDEKRIDIIGQNGNEGTHYGIATDEDIEECELNEELETPLKDYKGIYVERPHFDWNDGIEDEDEFDDYGKRRMSAKPTRKPNPKQMNGVKSDKPFVKTRKKKTSK